MYLIFHSAAMYPFHREPDAVRITTRLVVNGDNAKFQPDECPV